MASRHVRTLAVFPHGTHDSITYPAALVKTHDSGPARRFLDYLKSPPAQAIFAQHGFGIKENPHK
jgi:molybdate transport system substrate-binding protein